MFELERLNGTKYTRFMEGLPKKRNPRNPLKSVTGTKSTA